MDVPPHTHTQEEKKCFFFCSSATKQTNQYLSDQFIDPIIYSFMLLANLIVPSDIISCLLCTQLLLLIITITG